MSGDRLIRVLCIDDLPDVLAAMKLIVDAAPGAPAMACVGTLTTADRLIEEVEALQPPPDIVLLDATIPLAQVDPMQAMRDLSKQHPTVKTIIYSGWDDQAFINRAAKNGAWGVVSKHDPPERIVECIREVAAASGERSALCIKTV